MTAVARRLPKYGLGPGLALDLIVQDENGLSYNLNDPRQREKADRLLDDQRPLLLIGSPPCTPFSQIQVINKDRRVPKEVLDECTRIFAAISAASRWPEAHTFYINILKERPRG